MRHGLDFAAALGRMAPFGRRGHAVETLRTANIFETGSKADLRICRRAITVSFAVVSARARLFSQAFRHL